MKETQIKSRRIVKNTVLLYLRMMLTILVGLYTSRVLLDKLGFEDYGIYNVVGGVIVLFSFLSTALNSATQRFISVELGKGNTAGVAAVFGTSIYIYAILSVIILAGAETIGLWFLNTQMNFPAHKMADINWVYQISIFTFILNAIRTPFNACIISYEKMSFYAYTSIVEVVFKLLIIYIIDKSPFSQLVFYAVLTGGISLFLLFWYAFYCKKAFPHLQLKPQADSGYFKAMFQFSGWSLFGSLAVIGTNQGMNILLNIFYGVIVNAGMGIANQVTNVINQFTSNFQVAFNPQIVKGYANQETESVTKLIFLTARGSFFLLFIIALPFLTDAEYLLKLWLGNVPEYAQEFTVYLLLSLLIEAIAAPLYMTIQATGNIKRYQITVSILLSLNLIIGYALFKLNFSPVSVVVIRCIITFILLLYRIGVVSGILGFTFYQFIRKVLYPILTVSILYTLPLLYCKDAFGGQRIIYLLVGVLGSILPIYYIGLERAERNYLSHYIKSKFIRK